MTKRIREKMNVPFDVKSVDDESGTFEGYASVFGNVDLGGDVVVPGAFKRTLSHSGGAIPILWHHDPETPVGLGVAASEDERGLKVKGQLDLNTQKGREMLSGLKMGYIGAMSIGYEAVDKEMKDGVRYLKEIALPEYSLLTKGFAMNPEAAVFAVKAVQDFSASLAEAVAQDALWERRCDIDSALSDVMRDLTKDATLTDAQKVESLRTSLSQYADALASWFADSLAADPDNDGDMVGVMARELTDLAVKAGRRNSGADATVIRDCIDRLQSLLADDNAPDDDGKSRGPLDGAPAATSDDDGPRMDEAKRRELLNTLTRDLAVLITD